MATKFIQGLDKISVSKKKTLKNLPASVFLAPAWSDFTGRWLNCDAGTRGVTAMRISGRKKMSIQAWGACVPKWCKWGAPKSIKTFSRSVSSRKAVAFVAEWKTSFSERTMTATLCEGCLKVEIFTTFTDGSQRFNYYSSDCFFEADRTIWNHRTQGKI